MACVGCRYLDYEEKYTDCEIVDLTEHGFAGVRYWRRGPTWTEGPANKGNARNVQFCKLRGRIPGIFQCYNPGEMSCYTLPEDV